MKNYLQELAIFPLEVVAFVIMAIAVFFMDDEL